MLHAGTVLPGPTAEQVGSRGEAEDLVGVRSLIGRGRWRLARAVRSGWNEGTLARPDDGTLSSALSARHIEALLERVEGASPAPEKARTYASPIAEAPPPPRLQRVLAALGTAPVVVDLLGVLLAAEVDPLARALAVFLTGGIAGCALTVDVLLGAFADDAAAELLTEVGAGSGLSSYRLIEVNRRSDVLASAATVCLAPRMVRWFYAPDAPDREIRALGELRLGGEAPLPPSALALLEPLIADVHATIVSGAGETDLSDVVLHGPRGAGRAEVALEACRRAGRPALLVPLASVSAQPDLNGAVAALLREELLLDAQLVLLDGELLADGSAVAPRLRAALASSARPLIVVSSGPDQPRQVNRRKLITHHVQIFPDDRREAIWAELIPDCNAAEVASLYRIGVGAMLRVADAARYRVRLHGHAAWEAEIAASVRAEFASDLKTVATKVEVTQTWDDVVLPSETGNTIIELIGHLKHRATVLGRWGFGRKLGKGLGTTALFTGEPGTGKTMVAGLIAQELGVELYQVDLSRVVSKWLGETEKNLAKVFDAAETGHVVLLFDEADALLGRRTADVKSSNDRYANLETNYILQRLEAFQGVAILTSNLDSAIDPALSRRISFEVQFPFPDQEMRRALWAHMLPAEAPREADIDYDILAVRFEIAGGHISKIAKRAAYLAANENAILNQAYLLRAAELEYRDHGKLQTSGKLKT